MYLSSGLTAGNLLVFHSERIHTQIQRPLPVDLRREIVPFPSQLTPRINELIENPDPWIARFSITGGAKSYYNMMRETSPHGVAVAEIKRSNALLKQGSEVVSGKPGDPEADELAEWTIAWLKGISQFRLTVPKLVLNAIWWGFAPIELQWREFAWNGRKYEVPIILREKDPDQFRFNIDRELVWIGSGFGSQITFSGEEALGWFVPSYGSLDNPYGNSELRTSGAAFIYEVYRKWFKIYNVGLERSVGVLQAKKKVEAPNKKFSELQAELREYIAHLSTSSVLIDPPGWTVEWLANTNFAVPVKEAIDHLNTGFSLALTGESLSTRIGESSTGSRAALQVEETRTQGYVQADAAWMGGVFSDDFIAPAVRWNFPGVPNELLPKLKFKTGALTTPAGLAAYMAAAAEDDDFPKVDGVLAARELGVPILPQERT